MQKISNSKIAVIDDDCSVRGSICRLLTAYGYSVQGFARAEDFLTWEDLHSTACVISDVAMSGMDGLALQSCLTKAKLQLPIIFVTAFEDESKKARALSAGACCYLIKPVKADDLLTSIKTALSRGH